MCSCLRSFTVSIILYLPILAAFEFLRHQAEGQASLQVDQDSFSGYQVQSCSDMLEQSIANEENIPQKDKGKKKFLADTYYNVESLRQKLLIKAAAGGGGT